MTKVATVPRRRLLASVLFGVTLLTAPTCTYAEEITTAALGLDCDDNLVLDPPNGTKAFPLYLFLCGAVFSFALRVKGVACDVRPPLPPAVSLARWLAVSLSLYLHSPLPLSGAVAMMAVLTDPTSCFSSPLATLGVSPLRPHSGSG